MMRSMYAAVSGLRNHQIRMDVIGNNIANVNTVGFKSSRVTFQDTFYQMIRAGSAPDMQGGVGGTTPRQVGIGMALNTIDTYFTQGAVLPTGNFTDLMIQGDGFFVLQDAQGNRYYTRAGVFGFDAAGNLVNKANGMLVVGADGEPLTWDNLDKPANVDTPDDLSTLTINSRGEIVGDGHVMGVIGLVKFANPEGLEKVGQNLFKWTEAAHPEGAPDPGQAGSGGLGFTTIVPGALEMSNVDLALEFTEMITTQRGFQANARTITTSDEMLQELVNLKR
jgi:flagellar hook protein FlgE